MNEEQGELAGPNGRIVWRRSPGSLPGRVWLGGFGSDMTGAKASFLADRSMREGRAFLRFDYSGHGASDGRLEDGCIGAWAADAAAVLDRLTAGPQILIGSSMGAWIAALLARDRRTRVAGALFIAPAPDFTEELIWKTLDEPTRAAILREGRFTEPSPYGGATIITRKLIEDGRRHLVLGGPVPVDGPVRIIHGMRDIEVPFTHAIRFAQTISTVDLELTMVRDGDHRLSAPRDLERMARILAELEAAVAST